MIIARFYRKKDRYFGFSLEGHAEYAEAGEDILCSAVSALSINTVNCLDRLTSDRLVVCEEDGLLKAKVSGEISETSHILIKALMIGLTDIYKEYGDGYIRIFFKEVK